MSYVNDKNDIEINDKNDIEINDKNILINNDDNIELENNFNKQNEFCLICLEKIGIKILCTNCKYKYCIVCAKKINNVCTICIRMNTNVLNNIIDLDDYAYIYDNFNMYNDMEYQYTYSYFLTLCLSLIVNSIIMFCWIFLILFFGYIGFIFLYDILFQINNFIISNIKFII